MTYNAGNADFLRQKGLASAHREFLIDLTSGLRLSNEDAAAAASMYPEVWSPVLVSNLSGDKELSQPLTERTSQLIPSDAQPFFGSLVEHDGVPEINFSRGRLSSLFRNLYERKDAGSKSRFERVSDACAKFLFRLGELEGFTHPYWKHAVPLDSQTVVRFDASGQPFIAFAATHDEHPVEGPVRSIVSYGPGLPAIKLINHACGNVDELHLVEGGLGAQFVNSFTRLMYRALLAEAKEQPALGRVPEAHYYRDGIAASIGSIARKGAHKKVDVVLMSAVHLAGPAECLAGVAGAERLLRKDGLFVFKGPHVSLTGEAGLDSIAPAAEALFGSPVATGDCGTNAQYVDDNLPERRLASYAIYHKQ